MRAYIIRRLLLMIPTLFIVSFIIFLMIRLMPGTIVDAIINELIATTAGATETTIEKSRAFIEEELGLNEPIPIQYGRWLGVFPREDGSFSGIFQGDLGNSLWSAKSVVELILPKWPVTLELGIMALIISQLIALPVGIYSALRQDTWGDYIARSFAIMIIAIPGFWLGTMVIVFPSLWWGWSPPIMLIRFTEDPIGNLGMFIVPAIVLGMAMSGMTMRMTRTMMLEVLRQDYIRTAWAKGLRERVVIIRHALQNAFIPVITQMGLLLPLLIGGSVIIEQIFGLPGMGRLGLGAVQNRDYTTVSGLLLISAAAVMLINLAVDLTYAYLDPRVRYR